MYGWEGGYAKKILLVLEFRMTALWKVNLDGALVWGFLVSVSMQPFRRFTFPLIVWVGKDFPPCITNYILGGSCGKLQACNIVP